MIEDIFSPKTCEPVVSIDNVENIVSKSTLYPTPVMPKEVTSMPECRFLKKAIIEGMPSK